MSEPAWIVTARSLIGKVEDGPAVVDLAHKLAAIYPEYAPYLRLVHDDTPWCGEFVAYCLAANGIRPQFVQDSSDTNDFLWAQSWRKFGTAVDDPQVGDILVFARHVTFYVGEDATHYLCLGGNQSDAVNITRFRKESCEAIRRPAPVAVGTGPESAIAVTPVSPAQPSGNFLKVLPLLLESEGGNDDDPRDPGGRTSRGILQSEWDKWRQTHPGLPIDVWNAPNDSVWQIYWENYWLPLWCDKLPDGVDYAVFDFGVNSGISRSAKFLQRIVGTDQDGEIGPDTLAATEDLHPSTVVTQLCNDRMAFLQGLSTWDTFGRGWTARVDRVRRDSLVLAGNQNTARPILPSPKPEPVPMPPVAQPETPAPRVDTNIVGDLVKQLGPMIGDLVKAELQKPETQAAVKGLFATLVPKLLAGVGVSVPGVGIIMMVAGWVLPLLLPDLMGNDGGQSLLVSGAGVVGIPVVSKLLGILDRFKARQ